MSQATLNGVVEVDGGFPCDVWFEWGTNTSYGMTTPHQGGFYAVTQFSATLLTLGEGLTYHYRTVCQNRAGTVYGNDVSFVTRAPQFARCLLGVEVLLLIRR